MQTGVGKRVSLGPGGARNALMHHWERIGLKHTETRRDTWWTTRTRRGAGSENRSGSAHAQRTPQGTQAAAAIEKPWLSSAPSKKATQRNVTQGVEA